jgi:hypothetical protein
MPGVLFLRFVGVFNTGIDRHVFPICDAFSFSASYKGKQVIIPVSSVNPNSQQWVFADLDTYAKLPICSFAGWLDHPYGTSYPDPQSVLEADKRMRQFKEGR